MNDQFKELVLASLFYHINEVWPDANELFAKIDANMLSPFAPKKLIIEEAGQLSTGIESVGNTNKKFHKALLKPIFEKISISQDKKPFAKFNYSLKPFSLDEKDIFPIHEGSIPTEDIERLYSQLWKDFEANFKSIKSDNFYYLIDCYLSLLEKYTSFVPFSSVQPDLSLYDCLKATAGIASCIYVFHKTNDDLADKEITDRDTQKFILVGGDLSGIQKYIFDLVHVNLRRVSKILRARSFYLTALSKILITKILHENNLTPVNTLMESGGRFILLLPNTQGIKEYLQVFYNQLNEWCLSEFYGELMVGMDWSVAMSGNDFLNNRFRSNLEKLNLNLETQKIQRLNFKIKSPWKNNEFMLEKDYMGLQENTTFLCQTCGKKPFDENNKFTIHGEELEVCKTCYTQQTIGQGLTGASIISITDNNSTLEKYSNSFHFEIGKNHYFLNLHTAMNELHDSSKFITAFQISSTEQSVKPQQFFPGHFIANYVPRFDRNDEKKYQAYYQEKIKDSKELTDILKEIKLKSIKTFNDLSIPQNQLDNPKDSKGAQLLAIIKADVDNLGLIFSSGMKGDLSLSRYASLSRMLNVFFCGYLNQFLKDSFPNIYTVYAGGDDLFLIGNWREIIDFAPEFYEKFRSFTCNNPDIHLSAGIELIKPRSPVRKGAEQTEQSLENAKHFAANENNFEKNKLAIFKSIIEWKDWGEISNWIKFFDDKFGTDESEESRIKASFLYRLLKYQEMALRFFDTKDVKSLLYVSQLCYDLKRNIEIRSQDKVVNEEEIKKLKSLIDDADEIHRQKTIRNLHIPIFYTLYKNRGGTYE